MGLDPPTRKLLSSLLNQLAEAVTPRILLSLRPQDPIPDWITHLIHVTEDFRVASQGPKNDVLAELRDSHIHSSAEKSTSDGVSISVPETIQMASDEARGAPLIEMQGVKVKYGKRCVLGDWQQEMAGEKREGLWWTVQEGQRWGIFGANGKHPSLYLGLFRTKRLHRFW